MACERARRFFSSMASPLPELCPRHQVGSFRGTIIGATPSPMEERWISALEAFSRLAKYKHGNVAHAICARAADGVITARAKVLIVSTERRNDCDVPAAFWWARGREALTQSWALGDFETWIDKKYHCRAYGVTFREADIDAMIHARVSLVVGPPEAGDYAPTKECLARIRTQAGCGRAEAEAQLIRFCRAGMIAGRCNSIQWKIEDRFGRDEHEAKGTAVPDWFWRHCTGSADTVLDWVAGNFVGSGEIEGAACSVRITGVQLDVNGVLALEAMLSVEPLPTSMEVSPAKTGDMKAASVVLPEGAGGRPRSEKWSDWIAELAAFVHEEGIPDGAGIEGQDAVIAAIDSRLFNRDKEGPSRSTVQPVVRAVLQRMRSAGN